VSTPPKRQPIPFGKYLLLDRVNIGGMAEVWRAKTFGAGGFERLVAIKRILPSIAEDEEFISMFIDEAKITVQLNHANIAQIYELSHLASSYFIAMEYVSGRDMRALFDRCRKRGEPAPLPLVSYVMSKCCEGLDYAHRSKDRQGRDMNIVHRDVSPQNVLLSYDGEIKVIDFGIAKAQGKATKTQAGILKGKFGYMSPEQIRGLPLDRRSDVFALGICLYEMLTGERLFVGDSDFSVLEKVRKVEVLPPSHFNRKIPETLERIVMKALAKEVEDRYQFASELGDDLARFSLTSETVFGRKDLAAFLKNTFAEEYERERTRLTDYHDVQAPESMAAAADQGYAVAPAPDGVIELSSSSITAVPSTLTPGVAPSTAQHVPPAPSDELPSVRPASPTISPAVRASSATLPPVAAPSFKSLPRLTAASPARLSEKAEHAATLLVDPAQEPGQSGPMAAVEPTTDPLRNRRSDDSSIDQTLSGGLSDSAEHLIADLRRQQVTTAPATYVEPHKPGPPDVVPTAVGGLVPVQDSGPLPVPSVPPPRTRSVARRPTETVEDRPRPHLVASRVTSPATPVTPSGSRPALWVALAMMSALAIGAFAGIGYLVTVARQPKGLLFLNLPQGLSGKTTIEVNGTELTEKDGKPVAAFPTTREWPAGPITVMIRAPGYKPYIQKADVKAGNDFTEVPAPDAKLEPLGQ
jgi:eukaryotic-like serine/threonine-protein kinase